jgi:hypothetical protein
MVLQAKLYTTATPDAVIFSHNHILPRTATISNVCSTVAIAAQPVPSSGGDADREVYVEPEDADSVDEDDDERDNMEEEFIPIGPDAEYAYVRIWSMRLLCMRTCMCLPLSAQHGPAAECAAWSCR